MGKATHGQSGEARRALPTGPSKNENKATQKTKSPAPFSFLCSQTSLTSPEGTCWSERQCRLPQLSPLAGCNARAGPSLPSSSVLGETPHLFLQTFLGLSTARSQDHKDIHLAKPGIMTFPYQTQPQRPFTQHLNKSEWKTQQNECSKWSCGIKFQCPNSGNQLSFPRLS